MSEDNKLLIEALRQSNWSRPSDKRPPKEPVTPLPPLNTEALKEAYRANAAAAAKRASKQ